MPARLTGSGITRALQCPASFALPSVARDSKEASRGRQVHSYLEAIARGVDPAVAIESVDREHHAFCAAIDPRVIPPTARPEVAYTYDVQTGRAREIEVEGRAYPAGRYEIPGRLDLVVPETADHRATVVDWKTNEYGFEVEQARPQLEFYALCVARVEGLEEIDCAIYVLGENVKDPWIRWTLDLTALARVASRVKETFQRVELERMDRDEYERTHAARWVPDVVAGPHCRYCPAWDHCPAKRAALTAATPVVAEEIHLGDVLIRAQDLERWAKGMREAVKEQVETRGPQKTSDGRIAKIDNRGALKLVRAATGG